MERAACKAFFGLQLKEWHDIRARKGRTLLPPISKIYFTGSYSESGLSELEEPATP